MKTKFLMLSALATLTFVACQRENDGLLRLYVEGMGDGAKMAVEGGSSYWATGDKVNINGTEYTIDVSESGNSATVSATGATEYYGVYPSSIVDSRDGANYVLDLPSTYTYATTTHYNRTLQNVAAPMVGYAEIDENGTSMQFKHVTAAIGVQVVNYYGFTVEVDSIVLTSNLYKLCGETNVSLGNNITVLAAEATVDSTKRVKMKFDGDASLHVFAGDSAVVQIPVLPVGASNKFTVDVYLHKVDQPAVAAHFNKEQATAHSMDRRKIGYARTTFGGLFSVSASKKVVISQGNLQYQASTNTWKFAKHQYDAIGNALGNSNFTDTRSTQDDWIDLFGWGTSGHEHGNTNYMPYVNWYTSSNYAFGYGPRTGYNYNLNLTISNNGDWGVNAISNGGNIEAIWRTLSQTQLDSLLNKRSCNTINGFSNGRFAKATIKDGVLEVQGLIIFPDDYVHPTDVDPLWAINTTGSGGMNENKIDLASWNKMEVAGAVFLPITGIAKNAVISNVDEGCYWSTTYYNNSNKYYAKCLNFKNILLSVSDNQYRYHGCAVRLVRDVE